MNQGEGKGEGEAKIKAAVQNVEVVSKTWQSTTEMS